jgi:hypothetical protein
MLVWARRRILEFHKGAEFTDSQSHHRLISFSRNALLHGYTMCTSIYEEASHNKNIHHHDGFCNRHVNLWTRADCCWVVDLGWNWHTRLNLPLNHGSFTAEDALGVVRNVQEAEDWARMAIFHTRQERNFKSIYNIQNLHR